MAQRPSLDKQGDTRYLANIMALAHIKAANYSDWYANPDNDPFLDNYRTLLNSFAAKSSVTEGCYKH